MFILYIPSLCIAFKPFSLKFDFPLAKQQRKAKRKKYEKCVRNDDLLQSIVTPLILLCSVGTVHFKSKVDY